MKRGSPMRALAGAALLAFAVLAPGCARPPDEAWLRFLGFQAAGDSGTGSVSVIEGDVQDGNALKVDASLENQSRILGATGEGIGITIYRVEIDYGLAGFDPPSIAFPVSMYVPPAAAGGSDSTGGGTVVLSDIPIVPVSVKQWLIDHNASGGDGILEMTVKVDFLARTDVGDELKVGGGLAVSLSDAGGGGGGGGGGTTAPVLTIEASTPNARESPLTNGQFRVHRTGNTTSALSVSYNVSGTASPGAAAGSGADYQTLSRTLVISSGSSSGTIDVKPFADAAAEVSESVIVTLSGGAGYTVGAPGNATVTITDD